MPNPLPICQTPLAMTEPEVLTSVQNGVGRITLNRPRALNALNRGMCEIMTEALITWRTDNHVRSILIDHAGERGFCAGGDIRMIAESGAGDAVEAKAFISGAGTSDVYVVMARTGDAGPKGISAFVIDKDAPGLSFGAQERKMGWNAQPTAVVQFDDCRIPIANLLGEEGEGFKYAMAGLDGGRLNIAACSLGGARLALETAQDYLKTRKQFGKAIGDFQALQFRLRL